MYLTVLYMWPLRTEQVVIHMFRTFLSLTVAAEVATRMYKCKVARMGVALPICYQWCKATPVYKYERQKKKTIYLHLV
jgi:hypothetical protein